jgi:putative thioredoxin
VDGFVGVRSESELKAFIDKLLKLPGVANDAAPDVNVENIKKNMEEAAKFFAAGNMTDAMAHYSIALDQDPENMEAMAGIAWCFVAQGEMEGVQEILAQLTDAQKQAPRMKGLQWLVAQSHAAQGLDAPEVLAARLEKNPKDSAARHDLALHKIAAADMQGAIDALVELIRLEREWQDQKARKLLLDLFDAMGNAHPLTAQGRRKLSSVLFS